MGVPTTQRKWVEDRLKRGDTLTPFDAAAVGILRLGAIIFDLRESGWVIEDVNAKRGGGRYARHAAYLLRLRQGDA